MAKRIFTTPSNDGFFLCADFQKQQKLWLTWPERTDNWRQGAKPIQKLYVEIINKLINYHEINLLVSKRQFQNVRKQLNAKVKIIEMSTNDCFIKDYGPLFLFNDKSKTVRGLKSGFNAWGGEKYGVFFPWDYDDMVPYKIFELEAIDYYEIPIILHWGTILSDGNKTCFASEEGILGETINRNLTKEQAEFYLHEYLGVEQIIWIPFSLPYDQTKGRIDNLMTIVNETTILLSWTDNIYDERAEIVAAAYQILNKSTNINHERYKIHKIPLPIITNRTFEEAEMIDFNFYHNQNLFNQTLVASYNNLFLSDNIVVAPLFACQTTEATAKKVLEKVFADKTILFINIRELILGKSGIHSIVCQQIN